VTPIAVTTGVGPNGRKTVYYQDPSEDISGVFDPPANQGRQYQTLLDALQGEATRCEQLQVCQGTPVTDKENQAPQTPISTPSAAKAAAANLLLKAKHSIRRVAPKPTLEETLINMQKCVLFTLIFSLLNSCHPLERI
jgi:hypothetical protein